MTRRHLLVSISLLLTITFLVFISIIFRKIDLVSPPVPQEGVASNPKVTIDEATSTASMEISVMTYNVAGLPWPIGCGKSSRLTDENGKRYPIACDRRDGLRNIGDILGRLRDLELEPDIILLQEAFIAASAEVPKRANYPNWVAGPGPDDLGSKVSDRASEEFIAERSFWKGEKLGKRQPSGLLIASNFPIVEQFNFPFYQWECGGFDCLANKGVLMVRIRIPGLPDPLELITAHYNSKNSTGVPLERAHAAHRLQVDATREFLLQHSDHELPAVWGGDLNMRHSEERIVYFVEGARESMNEVSSWCLENPDACDLKIRSDSDTPWFENQDLQGWTSGTRVSVKPIRIEEIFDDPVDGVMASDHSGFIVIYRLSWAVS
jgi:endonuclease/exonuclease/phosphatase family metal-dependent hydrolase